MGSSFTTLFNHPSTPEKPQLAMGGSRSALPTWLRIAWFYVSPLGFCFAMRIAWEKTVWTIVRGPQMVGFSLVHIHPMFFLTGLLCSWFLMLWLVPALIYMIVLRDSIRSFEIAMVAVAVFVAAAVLIPDTFFATGR
jgi:hypothetical protein